MSPLSLAVTSSRPTGSFRCALRESLPSTLVALINCYCFHSDSPYPPYPNFSRGKCLTFIDTEGDLSKRGRHMRGGPHNHAARSPQISGAVLRSHLLHTNPVDHASNSTIFKAWVKTTYIAEYDFRQLLFSRFCPFCRHFPDCANLSQYR